jgi:SOS response regulatory protein OraA/RecX
MRRTLLVNLLTISRSLSATLRCRSGVPRNPWDFSPNDSGLEAAAFGTDEFTRQQRRESPSGTFAGEVEKAKSAALRMLGRRAHSRKELRRKLEDRGHPLEATDAALDRLTKVGLQSDREFAETFARSKWRQVKWGPGKIKAELASRGVVGEDVAAALDTIFGPDGLSVKRYVEEEAAEDGAAAWNPGGSPEAALLAAARRQWSLTSALGAETRRRRLAGWLQRRGHAWEDVSRLMRQIESEDAHERSGGWGGVGEG